VVEVALIDGGVRFARAVRRSSVVVISCDERSACCKLPAVEPVFGHHAAVATLYHLHV